MILLRNGNFMDKFFGHLKTVCNHRRLVRHYCFKCGLFWQGLTHDLSKFSRIEFSNGVKYYAGGVASPHNNERNDKGFSEAWINHKSHNKHHGEYWTDFNKDTKTYLPVPMPRKYVAEMVCDRISASRTYNGKKYNDSFPLEYFLKEQSFVVMHSKTQDDLIFLLTYLKNNGEKKTFKYIRKVYLKGK